METKVLWNDLLIEEGKLDPLALWRVGDRLIGDLLSPFTTVVGHRPARYFSMYSWIIYHLNKQKFNNRQLFWRRFYELEAVLLCAIQLHEKHNYEYFMGQIGSESAKKIIENVKRENIELGEIDKIKNGWEPNYKQPMYSFQLLETDYGMVSGMKVTERGEQIALAYKNSIKSSTFYKDYLDKTSIPLDMIRELVTKYVICPQNREIKCPPIRAIWCTFGVTQKYSGGIAYAQKGGLYDY